MYASQVLSENQFEMCWQTDSVAVRRRSALWDFFGHIWLGKQVFSRFDGELFSGAFLDISLEKLSKRTFPFFHADSLCGVSLNVSWEELGKQTLSLFDVDPLPGLSLSISWEGLGKQNFSLFPVDF